MQIAWYANNPVPNITSYINVGAAGANIRE